MSHEDFNQELNALRENLPTLADEESASPGSVPAIYTLETGKRAYNYALEGLTLRQISRKPGMPELGVLIKWAQQNSEFAKMLRAARVARALLHEEEVFRIAEEIDDPKDAVKAKVQIDAHKWGAEVCDPTVYGKKVAHSGEVSQTVKFVKVVTGFGPLPDALKFPELNPDGTIKKPEPTPVESEVVNGPGHSSDDSEAQPPGNEGSTEAPGSPDASLGSSGY